MVEIHSHMQKNMVQFDKGGDEMLHVAIVEDDLACANKLVQFLERYGKENGKDIRSTVFHDGLDIVENYAPVWDIILLDIEMPLMDGMTAAERIRTLDTTVILIFITNMAQYAIKGYEVDAMDFVLKPVNYYAFNMKLQKACRVLAERSTAYVMVPANSGTRKLLLSLIRYIEVADHRLIYHSTEGIFEMFGSLKEVEATLGKDFARCNHCYLVNLKYVDGIQADNVILGQDTLKISRTKKKEFVQRVSDYYRYGGR